MITSFFSESNGNENQVEKENVKNKYSLICYKKSKLYLDLNTGLNVHYTSEFINKIDSKVIFKILEKRLVYNPANESKVLILGKYIDIPRTQTAYGDPGTFYKFAGNVVYAKNWLNNGPVENIVRDIGEKLELYSGTKFNFVLINRYKNGSQYIGFHSDDEEGLGDEPKIAGVSFGAIRPIYFQNKKTGTTDIKIDLEPGSVLLMNHPTNVYWKHSIPKTSKEIGIRISLTYRKMICDKL